MHRTITLVKPFGLATVFAVSLFGCATGGSPADEVAGTYIGSIAGVHTATDYTVSVTAVDDDTIMVEGADFTSFELDVRAAGGFITGMLDDDVNTLSYGDDVIDLVHEGDEEVVYSGGKNGATAPDLEADDDVADGSVASAAAGTYTGSITGPITSDSYTITLTANGDDQVDVSGADFDTFTVPLAWDETDIDAAGAWSDGAFSLSDGDLDITYTPHSLAFSGSAD